MSTIIQLEYECIEQYVVCDVTPSGLLELRQGF
jgi:hypothetical protein